MHAFHDEQHLLFEFPAMQCVRVRYPTLFSPANNTMQLFMWQGNIRVMQMFCAAGHHTWWPATTRGCCSRVLHGDWHGYLS